MVVWDLWLTITTLVLGLHPRSKVIMPFLQAYKIWGEGDSKK